MRTNKKLTELEATLKEQKEKIASAEKTISDLCKVVVSLQKELKTVKATETKNGSKVYVPQAREDEDGNVSIIYVPADELRKQ